MKKNYVLEWLDNVITTELNPEKKDLQAVTTEHARAIKTRIEQEEEDLMSRLKVRVFNMRTEADSKMLVKKYHDALIEMIVKNYDNLHHPATKKGVLKELHEFIGNRLQRMLLLFERELSHFMDEENRVPITQMVQLKTEITEKIPVMEEKLSKGEYGEAPVAIIMNVINEFLDKIENRLPVTVRSARYIKDLVHDVVSINGETTSITGCPVLNELLIIWNLNSKACIRYFTQGTKYLMNEHEGEEAQLAFLKLEAKKLQVIPEKQNHILNPDFPSVKEYCSKWLENEIAYREGRSDNFVPAAMQQAGIAMKENTYSLKLELPYEQSALFLRAANELKIITLPDTDTALKAIYGITPDAGKQPIPTTNTTNKIGFKIVLALSVDQFALFVRAADDLRIITAKSFSAILKAIVPFISTPYKAHLNWDNVRTKAYVGEETDKAAITQELERIIRKISSYKKDENDKSGIIEVIRKIVQNIKTY